MSALIKTLIVLVDGIAMPPSQQGGFQSVHGSMECKGENKYMGLGLQYGGQGVLSIISREASYRRYLTYLLYF